MTNRTEHRGVTVERVPHNGYHNAYLPGGRITADDRDGALAEIDRQAGPYLVTVTLTVSVDPDEWIDAHGTPRHDVADDVRRRLPERIAGLLRQGCVNPPNGVTLTAISVTDPDGDDRP